LIVQKDFSPDGWLGIIVGSKIYINFTKSNFEDSMKHLLQQISLVTEKRDSLTKKTGPKLDSLPLKHPTNYNFHQESPVEIPQQNNEIMKNSACMESLTPKFDSLSIKQPAIASNSFTIINNIGQKTAIKNEENLKSSTDEKDFSSLPLKSDNSSNSHDFNNQQNKKNSSDFSKLEFMKF
jgi:hypothetical protein